MAVNPIGTTTGINLIVAVAAMKFIIVSTPDQALIRAKA